MLLRLKPKLSIRHFHSFVNSLCALGESRRRSPRRRLEISPCFQQPLIDLHAPHQGANQPCLKFTYTTCCLARFCTSFPLVFATRLTSPSLCGILVTWPKHHSWNLFVWTRGSKFRPTRISQLRCELCRSALRLKLFVNNSPLQLALLTALFRSLPKIHDHRWGSEQRPI